MKRRILFSFLLLPFAIIANAQLRVSSDGNVGIRTLPSTSSLLTVGSNNIGNASLGIASSPEVVANKNNIGVDGAVIANSSYTNNTNYGVLGIVSPINCSHGRNYGVSGMIGYPNGGTFFGGTGVYGTHSTYFYSYPTNIYGAYAGYFTGSVYVSNNLTAPNLFTTSDSRLSENLVSLGERDNSGKTTLENILNMNVVEYNLKGRQYEEISENVDPEKAEELRKELEYLKKEDKEMTSRRHFGVNAEELQELYPDLVLEGQDGYLSVNYSELVPLLIRSIQVLKQELDEVKSKSKAQKRAQATGINASSASGNFLYQNAPNPFKEQTIIRFKLAEGVQDASVCIFDMTGKTLKKLPISSGMESVSIGGYELGEGMFLYSLIVNGQEIDTKKMVIQ
jgi:hypothetical protein